MTFITAHWAMILSILAIVHVTVSSILGLLNKPKAETFFEQVWHYVQIAAGLDTKLAASKDSTVRDGGEAVTSIKSTRSHSAGHWVARHLSGTGTP